MNIDKGTEFKNPMNDVVITVVSEPGDKRRKPFLMCNGETIATFTDRDTAEGFIDTMYAFLNIQREVE